MTTQKFTVNKNEKFHGKMPKKNNNNSMRSDTRLFFDWIHSELEDVFNQLKRGKMKKNIETSY